MMSDATDDDVDHDIDDDDDHDTDDDHDHDTDNDADHDTVDDADQYHQSGVAWSKHARLSQSRSCKT